MLSSIGGSRLNKCQLNIENENPVLKTGDIFSPDFVNRFYIGGKSPRRTSRLDYNISGWEDSSGGWRTRPVLSSFRFQNLLTENNPLSTSTGVKRP